MLSVCLASVLSWITTVIMIIMLTVQKMYKAVTMFKIIIIITLTIQEIYKALTVFVTIKLVKVMSRWNTECSSKLCIKIVINDAGL